MSASADNELIADSEEDDIFGPPESYPVLSSSESWHESEDPSSESDDEKNAENASGADQVKGEDEDSQSDSGLKKGKQKDTFTKSRLQLDKRTIQAYKTLLKDMHVDPDAKTWNKQQNVTLSTVGLVQWTGKENDTLFTALARKGRGNIGEIAQQIGSKSRLEVADYIEFLEERLQRHQYSEPSLLEAEIPAAVEISEELEDVLDHFAETVAIEEQKKDFLEAEKEHGSSEFWILDRAKADKVEELLASNDEDALPEAISPSAGLLNLKNWVRLSEKIFMNPGRSRPEDSWKNVAQKGETPSLTADALGELYDMTVDLVIRLMEEAHNTALERLDKERRHSLPFVRKKDVRRALTTMGMKHNTFDYYIHLPRRLKIDVIEWKRKGTADVSYDQVERMLSKKREKRAKESLDTSDDCSEEDTENDEKDVAEGDDEEDDLDEFGSSEDESETQRQDDHPEPEEEVSNDDKEYEHNVATPKSKPIDDSDYEDIGDSEHARLELEKRLDDYNAYIDRQASHKEEARIRELLSYPALNDKGKQGKPPVITQEMRREIMRNNAVVDWRKDLVYRDEWETYGMKTRDVERDIVANRNKRRRLE
ncbi:hypothetical protein TCE0_024r07465 [Talaromyces pinophilus]|jgi:RNA polymerase I-specific transcription initiation factor RRN5|uniref:Uncharacterized protein n=1 Tax=Talaromyces pinophilus TaxID=128442 RepID=A0A6V8H8T2_TALPI|nr:hypothetical protein TCE0_024r07465 [Talaromyces pinophilus]